ncbi:hypothetical protein CCZ01_07940 [Helicobacter monodelphidis]|uniref:zeta toxin family protein n=1 Tax=Helicobacter sp. 15-1451 TaxID=2004995 RepID=UPI000DCC683D|nr:zeta toxin family protein [Helicobacter sp. 15-1451]RAX56975.1 hypothetical protein CCZ01_07940 [Helicobacter sp. 15-1451]
MNSNEFERIWEQEIGSANPLVTPHQQNPKGFVLGGQPGAGKSALIQKVKEQLQGNVVVINADDLLKGKKKV